ncbi:MAG: hypothetical protein GEU86_01700 [Actinophytocola sp.]|nr:hypothetical protein [Actinophytocola sp.]
MAEVHEGTALPLRLHNLLLALAGRLDDSALSHARRLAVKARADEAVELIAGSLIAGRLPLREAEHRELAAILIQSGSEPGFAEQVRVDDAAVDGADEHRFSGHDAPEDGIVPALERVSYVLPGLRSVHAVWRNSTAGRVPGPMPQRVVLIEMGSGGSAPATAHRVQAALRHAGISASVEVSAPNSEWTRYHERALASAVAVWSATAAVRRVPAAERPGRSATHAASGEQATQEPEPAKSAPAQQAPAGPNFDVAPSAEQAIGAQRTREIARPEQAPEPARQPEPEPQQQPAAQQQESQRQPEPEPEQAVADSPPTAQSAMAAFTELNFDPFSGDQEPAGHGIEPAGAAAGSPPGKWEQPADTSLVPGELFWPQADTPTTRQTDRNGHAATPATPATPEAPEPGRAGPESPAERTTEFSPVEPPVNLPGDAKLSDRDRELLAELHAELAKREREQAAQVQINGWEHPA